MRKLMKGQLGYVIGATYITMLTSFKLVLGCHGYVRCNIFRLSNDLVGELTYHC